MADDIKKPEAPIKAEVDNIAEQMNAAFKSFETPTSTAPVANAPAATSQVEKDDLPPPVVNPESSVPAEYLMAGNGKSLPDWEKEQAAKAAAIRYHDIQKIFGDTEISVSGNSDVTLTNPMSLGGAQALVGKLDKDFFIKDATISNNGRNYFVTIPNFNLQGEENQQKIAKAAGFAIKKEVESGISTVSEDAKSFLSDANKAGLVFVKDTKSGYFKTMDDVSYQQFQILNKHLDKSWGIGEQGGNVFFEAEKGYETTKGKLVIKNLEALKSSGDGTTHGWQRLENALEEIKSSGDTTFETNKTKLAAAIKPLTEKPIAGNYPAPNASAASASPAATKTEESTVTDNSVNNTTSGSAEETTPADDTPAEKKSWDWRFAAGAGIIGLLITGGGGIGAFMIAGLMALVAAFVGPMIMEQIYPPEKNTPSHGLANDVIKKIDGVDQVAGTALDSQVDLKKLAALAKSDSKPEIFNKTDLIEGLSLTPEEAEKAMKHFQAQPNVPKAAADGSVDLTNTPNLNVNLPNLAKEKGAAPSHT